MAGRGLEHDSERARRLARAWHQLARAMTVKRTPRAELARQLAAAADMFAGRGEAWAVHAGQLRRRARELEEG